MDTEVAQFLEKLASRSSDALVLIKKFLGKEQSTLQSFLQKEFT